MEEFVFMLESWLRGNSRRLVSESQTFLTDEEKACVQADPKSYLLYGQDYRRLFCSLQMVSLTATGTAWGLYRKREIAKTRPFSYFCSALRAGTLAYIFSFCMLTDSLAFYQHLYSRQLLNPVPSKTELLSKST